MSEQQLRSKIEQLRAAKQKLHDELVNAETELKAKLPPSQHLASGLAQG